MRRTRASPREERARDYLDERLLDARRRRNDDAQRWPSSFAGADAVARDRVTEPRRTRRGQRQLARASRGRSRNRHRAVSRVAKIEKNAREIKEEPVLGLAASHLVARDDAHAGERARPAASIQCPGHAPATGEVGTPERSSPRSTGRRPSS